MIQSAAAVGKKNMLIPLIIIGILYFVFGFVTWLNGILIPYLQIACELSNFQAVFVAFAFYISYTVMALPSSRILEKTGFKNGIVYGLFIMALGTLIFVPAALLRVFPVFLLGLFVMGTGLALLQTAVNPYVTILGPGETAAVRLGIMGICNNFAGAIAPLILAYYILSDGDAFVAMLRTLDESARITALDELSARVIGPYIVMTLSLAALGLLVRYSHLPDVEEEQPEITGENLIQKKNIFQYPYLVLGVITLFFYVGVEVIAANTIVNYGISLGVPIESARSYTTMVMITMLAGYLAGISLIPRILSYKKVLISSSILGLILTTAALTVPSHLYLILPWVNIKLPYTVMFIALLGLANSMMWPSIWPLAIHGLGHFIKLGSAMMIMAIAGGAILPLLWGFLSDVLSERLAYCILIPSYLIIFLYSIFGSRIRNWRWHPDNLSP